MGHSLFMEKLMKESKVGYTEEVKKKIIESVTNTNYYNLIKGFPVLGKIN